MWLGGSQPSAADRDALAAMPVPPSAETHPNTFAWWCLAAKFTPPVRAQWTGEAKQTAAAEDEFDPFADEEEDEEAEKARMERMKALAKPAK